MTDSSSVHISTVSIIVPVYNGAGLVSDCANALLSQACHNVSVDIIFVDNGSTDRTMDVLQSYTRDDRVRIVSETAVRNAYGARNAGARMAHGQALAFTDADCVPEPNWLAELLAGLGDPSVGVAVGDILPYATSSVVGRCYSEEGMSLRGYDVTKFCGMRAGNCIIRAECFRALGGFDATVPSGGDSRFLGDVIMDGRWTFAYCLDAIVRHRNYESLQQVFRRGLRYGNNVHTLKSDPLRCDQYVPLGRHIIYVMTRSIATIGRALVYPMVRGTGVYRGRPVGDMRLFLARPLVELLETFGVLVGRLVRSQRFR